MHSSTLRGVDFEIFLNQQPISHADFFVDFSPLIRVGLFAPNGIDGVGATALTMAFVTAFYNCYRAEGEDFFAYPAYYTFQHVRPLASYTMLDIWPKHKDVWVQKNPVALLNAVNDRAINILILPEGEPGSPNFERAQLETAKRTIRSCYLYSAEGKVNEPTLEVTLNSRSVVKWTELIFNDHEKKPVPSLADQKSEWLAQYGDAQFLTQSFRQITVEDALTRLG
ncbi:MAG: hypothetical protein AAF633_12305 [Chloroflexota bacterium]